MDEESKDIISEETETRIEDLPTADEADVKPSITDADEPKPFDPYNDVAVSPTPESVAEDLKTATTEGVEYGPEPEEEPAPSKPAETPAPEEKIEAPKPEIIEDNASKRFIIFIVIAAVILVGGVVAGIFLLGPAIFGGKMSIGGGGARVQEAANNVPERTVENDPYQSIAYVWQSQPENENYRCFVFTPVKTFYILDNCGDFTDNYYYGNIEARNGNAALVQQGTSLSQIEAEFSLAENSIATSDVYLLKMEATEIVSGGMITTEVPVEMTMLFVRTGDNEVVARSNESGEVFNLTKRTDIQVPTRSKCGQTYFNYEDYDANKGCVDSSEE